MPGRLAHCPICAHHYETDRARVYAGLQGQRLMQCLRCDLLYLVGEANKEEDIAHSRYPIQNLYLPLQEVYLEKARKDLSLIGRGPPGRLLDVGCGVGTFVTCALERGWDAYGVEPNLLAVEFAHSEGLTSVMAGTLGSIDLGEDQFDVVTAFGVIEHVRDPARLIGQVKSLLRPHGLLVLQTPTQDGLFHKVGRAMYLVSLGRLRFQIKELVAAGHCYIFSRRSITALLNSQGMQVLTVEGYGNPLPILLRRYRDSSLFRRLIMVSGVAALFYASELLHMRNHILVFAEKLPNQQVDL